MIDGRVLVRQKLFPGLRLGFNRTCRPMVVQDTSINFMHVHIYPINELCERLYMLNKNGWLHFHPRELLKRLTLRRLSTYPKASLTR